MSDWTRRSFLKTTAAATVTLATTQALAKSQPSERLRVGVMGAGGRAMSLLQSFSDNPNAEVVTIADLDPRRFPKAVEEVSQRQKSTPKTVTDFRRMIEDPSLDAIVIGTPDHWHAIPTIMACQAGKDVYVEKPDGHNIVEGQRMVAAMKKHERIVQLGTQSRTTERMRTAMEFIKTGALGQCLVAKAWESTRQGNIGHPKDGDAPEGVDYDMWIGPAQKRPFNPNRFHGNWRWFYDLGTGDLGNDGVHRLDMALWALQAACAARNEPVPTLPRSVNAAGGKWYFDDMQEWPDTLQVSWEFDGKPPRLLTYELRIWSPYPMFNQSEGAALYGDKGVIIIGNSSWIAYDAGRNVIGQGEGGSHEAEHVQNFIDCVKSRQKPNADLETVGHPSSLLCHMGNIATRLGRTLKFDAATETFIDDKEANALRTRAEYRKPWELPEV